MGIGKDRELQGMHRIVQADVVWRGRELAFANCTVGLGGRGKRRSPETSAVVIHTGMVAYYLAGVTT